MYRVWGPDHGPGDVTPGLIELCRDWIKPDFEMAEVGCFRGVSTRVFACFARAVFAVDAWTLAIATGYRDIKPAMLAAAEREFRWETTFWKNIRLIRELSLCGSARFQPGELDAVYLDADHMSPGFLNDVRCWLPTLKPTGLLMGHDWDIVGQWWEELDLPPPVKVYSELSWVMRVEDIT